MGLPEGEDSLSALPHSFVDHSNGVTFVAKMSNFTLGGIVARSKCPNFQNATSCRISPTTIDTDPDVGGIGVSAVP